MNRRDIASILQVELAILEDCRAAYPALAVEFERDARRLSQCAEDRGLGFFTLDLPSLDSILLDGLENGVLVATGPLTRRRSRTDQRPRFFFGLWSLIFDNNARLLADADPTAIYLLRQLTCLGKKIEVECTHERQQAAVREYHSIESALPSPNMKWDEDDVGSMAQLQSLSFRDYERRDDGHLDLYQDAGFRAAPLYRPDLLDVIFGQIAVALGELNPFELRYKHGPGAVADLVGSRYKYQFPTWPAKLDGLFPFDWCGATHIDQRDRPSANEPPSRLIAVPKTAKTPRLIAAEPTAHQWCQQAIFRWMDERFRATWIGDFIDLRDQSKSQTMVRQASLDGRLATVDLSSASDRLSCKVVERAFRGNYSLLAALHSVRTRWIRDDISDVPLYRKIKKFAAQGSAVTFPVQSVIFLGLALHSAGWDGRLSTLRKYRNKVRVFGDDIILPVHGYARLVSSLTTLGLKANLSKSFWKGRFRESCGSDCFMGYDVTPLKPKSLDATGPEKRLALIDTANNLWRKGCWHASKAVEAIAKEIFANLPITGANLGSMSLLSFCGSKVSHLKSKWCTKLHVRKLRIFAALTKNPRKRIDAKEALLQYFTERPNPILHWSSGVTLRPKIHTGLRWVDPVLLGL